MGFREDLVPVTLLFTDIAGSTRLWQSRTEVMHRALEEHDRLLREIVLQHGGEVFKTVGDAFFCSFSSPTDAVKAALDAQEQLAEQVPLLRVRMAVHTGQAEARAGDYFGPPLNHVARLLAAGHGGQILISEATLASVRDGLPEDVRIRPLGNHRLRDIELHQSIFQVHPESTPGDFPPLNTENVAFRRGLVRASWIAAVVVSLLSFLTWQAISNADRAEAREEDARLALVKEGVARKRLQTTLVAVRKEQARANREAQRATRQATAAERARLKANQARDAAAAARDTANRARSVADAARAQAATNATRALAAAGRERQAKGVALTEAERARGQLYVAQMSLMQQAWDSGNIARTRELLASQVPPPGKTDLRDFEWQLYWQRCASRDLFTLKGHTGMVPWMDLSPDGKTAASASFDQTVRIWDLTTHASLADWKAHKRWVTCSAYSPDGKTLATCGDDGEVKLWEVATRKLTATFACKTGEFGTNLAWSRDGGQLAWVTTLGAILTVSPRGGTPQRVKLSTGVLFCVIYGADGRSPIVAGFDKIIWVMDPDGVTIKRKVPHEMGDLSRLALSPDGTTLAVGGFGGKLQLWDARTYQLQRVLAGHRQSVAGMSFSPDGRLLATGSFDQTIKIWNVGSGTERITYTGHTGQVGSVRFTANGSTLFSTSGDTTIKAWDVNARPPTSRLPTGLRSATVIAAARKNPKIAAGGGGTGNSDYYVWDPKRPDEAVTFSATAFPPIAMALSPDARYLAVSGTKEVRIWDTNTRSVAFTDPKAAQLYGLQFSPGGRYLAAAYPETGEVVLREVGTWRTVGRARAIAINVASQYALDFTPDDKTLLVNGGDGTIRLCRASDGKPVGALDIPGRFVRTFRLSPNGRLLAVATGVGIQLWDLEQRRQLGELTGHRSFVLGLSFSPSSRTLLSTSDDGTIKLWSMALRQELATLKDAGAQVMEAEFLSDGSAMVTRERQGELRLYEAAPLTRPAAPPRKARGEPRPDACRPIIERTPIFTQQISLFRVPHLAQETRRNGI